MTPHRASLRYSAGVSIRVLFPTKNTAVDLLSAHGASAQRPRVGSGGSPPPPLPPRMPGTRVPLPFPNGSWPNEPARKQKQPWYNLLGSGAQGPARTAPHATGAAANTKTKNICARYRGRTIAVVFCAQGLPGYQNGRAWARWIANYLSYSMRPFACVLVARKVFFLENMGG